METSDTLTLRQALVDYLEARLSLAGFVEAHTLAIHQTSLGDDSAALDFAFEVELRLAEYQNGDWTEIEFRDRLAALRSTYVVQTPSDVVIESGVASTLILVPVLVVSASADRSHGTALA